MRGLEVNGGNSFLGSFLLKNLNNSRRIFSIFYESLPIYKIYFSKNSLIDSWSDFRFWKAFCISIFAPHEELSSIRFDDRSMIVRNKIKKVTRF